MSDNYTDFDEWWEEFKVGRNDVQLFSLKCASKCAWDAAVTKCALDVVVNSEQPFGDIPCTIKMPEESGEEVPAKPYPAIAINNSKLRLAIMDVLFNNPDVEYDWHEVSNQLDQIIRLYNKYSEGDKTWIENIRELVDEKNTKFNPASVLSSESQKIMSDEFRAYTYRSGFADE